MNLLITGAAGFIGSNFVTQFISDVKLNKVIALDNLDVGSDRRYMDCYTNEPGFLFIKGDICEPHLVRSIIRDHEITHVVHFAAQSHVDRSISGPLAFLKTNVEGTVNLLESCRHEWKDFAGKKFVYVSTDEVYGSIDEGQFTEESNYAPNSPYSASKAAGDMFCRAYYETYKMPVVVTHCSNNYGPRQHMEKLIPTVMNSLCTRKDIPVYGSGKNIRNWIYVDDHNTAVMAVLIRGNPGETYNIGGDVEISNIDLVKKICKAYDKIKAHYRGYQLFHVNSEKLIKFVQDRKGHDFRYSVNSDKIKKQLKWKPTTNFNDGLAKTVEYYANRLIIPNTPL